MQFTIGKKLGMGFALILVLMVLSAWIAYWRIKDMEHSTTTVVEESFPNVSACLSIQNSLNRSLAALRGYMILGDDKTAAARFKKQRSEAWTAIDTEMQRLEQFYKGTGTPEERRHFSIVQSTLPELRKAQQEIEDVAQSDNNIVAHQILTEQAAPKSQEVLQAITRMIDAEDALQASPERKKLLKHMADFRGSFARAVASLRAYLLSGKGAYRTEHEAHMTANQVAYDEMEKQSEQWMGPQVPSWAQLKKSRNDFLPLPEKMFQARSAPDWNKASHLLETEAAPKAETIDTSLKALKTAAQESMKKDRSKLESASGVAITTLVTATLIAIALGVLVAFLLSRKLVRSIGEMVTGVEAVASGDLSRPALPANEQDELGQLASGFNHMILALKQLTGQIHAVTENVHSACAQIQASSQEQATTTREQAATTQEITSTMQEVSQSGQQIVEKAKDVLRTAEAASSATREGIKAVQSTTRTMDHIREQVEEVAETIVTLSERAQAVGEIISTVNEIAEQSNLLALNASIEAAEAGEDGNRFSVVANEMKNLADQAKECTVQVRTILSDIQKGINTSVMLTEEAVKRVEVGKEQADVGEQTIREMHETTESSAQAFQQIIGAANQQQIGFEQVSQGMLDISQATEQTATGTSQLNEAVASLMALSEQLKTAVGQYRM